MRYWGFDLAVTLAGIASGFWVRFKCREADLDKTGGAWGGRFFPLFSRLQRLYFHRTPREPLPVQATNNCVVAPEQRGPRTFFAQLLSKSTSDLTSQGTPAHSNRLSGRLVPNRLDNTSSEGTLGVLGTEKALLLSLSSHPSVPRVFMKRMHMGTGSRVVAHSDY